MLNLDPNGTYLLACSYGPDSMALFGKLKKLGVKFIVAHVNYGVRKEAKKETEDLNDYCAKNDIEIEIKYCKNLSKTSNFEAKAREIRYSFFKTVYDRIGADALLVAHQEDDVMETFFLQRKRGGFVEHFGIMWETTIFGMRVLRPLLDETKTDLLFYCQANQIPYAIDSSNLTDDFSRNVIRHTIVSKMNERERRNTMKTIDALNRDINAIYRKLESLDLNDRNTLLSLNEEELQRALIILVRRTTPEASISSALSKELRKVMESPKPNVRYEVTKSFAFLKEYDWASFATTQKDVAFSYRMEKPGLLNTSYFFMDFTNGSKDRNVNDDDYPITIRSAAPDDKVKIGTYVSVARRLFIDWKMPLSLRKRWPVIVNRKNEIVFMPRYRANYKIKKDDNFYAKTK